MRYCFQFILAAAAALSAGAQTPVVSPIPQEASYSGAAFASEGATFRLTGADEADSDAVGLLNALPQGAGVEIVVGEAGDEAVASWADKIPSQAQGYYLLTEPGRVVVAGRDEAGTFYGVQTLRQLLEAPEVPAGEIRDWPVNAVRGVIEGFYGNPWSFEARCLQFEFYGRNKMNIYIYGPKDDVYHRSQCYDPYPEAEAAHMASLVSTATANKVEFIWAMHPGNNIGSDRYAAAISKFQQLYDLGIRRFAIFYDDISANSVDQQIAYLNYLDDNFVKTHEGVGSLIVCPTQYNRAYSGGDYLSKMGNGLHADIEIMWTGAGVVDMELKGSSQWFTQQTGRKPFIWLNYPVNDYGGQSLMMGAYPAAAADIDQYTTAFCSNPMQYAEASKVSLYSIADFTWNPGAFERQSSWERSIETLVPAHAEAFRAFCENNKYYHQSTHGLVHPDTETPAFKEIIDAGREITAGNIDALTAYFNSQASAGAELLGALEEYPVLKELKEWIQCFDFQGQRGQKIMEMAAAIDSENPASFIDLYQEYQTLTAQADALVSGDWEGSIRRVRPSTGMQYVEPWLGSAVETLVDEFKVLGIEYPEGLFPARFIESGQYFILYRGRYLTNKEGSTKPTFVAERNDFTPNTQVWTIKYCAETGRYSLRSAQDDRYVNELCNFGTNPYSDQWNTYSITGLGGLYAFQCGGNSGTNYWTMDGYQIQRGSVNSWNLDNFLWQIVPVETETLPAVPAEPFIAGDYVIKDLEGNVLQRSTTPTFRTPGETAKTSQIWNLSVDETSGRIKVMNRTGYLNEVGKMGTNEYSHEWNSYELYSTNGRYAIRNAQRGGTNYWYVNNSKQISSRAGSLAENLNFEIVPVEEFNAIDEITAPSAADGLIYDLQGRRVVNPSKGLYIVNGQKVIVK